MAANRPTTSGSVRKRTWRTAAAEPRSAWLATYVHESATLDDGVTRHRRQETFGTRREAVERLAQIRSEIAAGRHVPQSTSITVAEAASLWLQQCAAAGLERSSIRSYRTLAELHVLPILGARRLSQLTAPAVEQFVDKLVAEKSRAIAARSLTALKSIIGEAQRRGLAAHNAAAPVKVRTSKRHDEPVTIPQPAHVAALLAACGPKERALVATLALAGLRASEARALEWSDLDLEARTLTVSRRADRWCSIGSPKSAAGRRTIPMSPLLLAALREWRLASPHGAELVFPTSNGTVQFHSALTRSLQALMRRAGLEPFGLHQLRHFCISSWLAAGFGIKAAQTWAGHSSPLMTLGTYGHFMPGADDGDRLAAAEARLVGTAAA